MRSFAILTVVLAASSFVACSAPTDEADDTVASAATRGLDAFGQSLVGNWGYLPLADSFKAFDGITLRADSTYEARGVAGATKVETGTFRTVARTRTLTLAPATGARRSYVVEVGEEGSSLALTRAGRTTVVTPAAGTPVTPGPIEGEPATGFCPERRGGALVTFDIAGEPLAVWSTNADFIAEAKVLVGTGDRRTPMFEKFLDGKDCDTRYTWHVDPAAMSFADFTIELCDGTPSYLENNKKSWGEQVKSYCPWGPKVTKVEERP